MLTSLSICNYAIISRLNIDFSKGFSAITGETGAGKSIIMGALGLVLGQRSDSHSVRSGESKCTVEAEFEIEAYGLKSFFEENDLDYDDCSIIRREVLNNGKSRAFINDTPVTLAQLKVLGERLIDIHSQHANLLLKDDSFQIQVVDTIAQDKALKTEYQTHFRQYRTLLAQLNRMIEERDKLASDKEYFQFQFDELAKANLKEDEQETLEEEQSRLTHAGEIKIGLSEADALLSDEEQGILKKLKDAINALKRIEKFTTTTQSEVQRLDGCHIELKDLADAISVQLEQMDFDPQRTEEVNNRLDLIYTLQHKHHVQTISDLISLKNALESKLGVINNSDEEEQTLRKQIMEEKSIVEKIAVKLTAERSKSAKSIGVEMEKQLKELGMPDVRFEVAVTPLTEMALSGADKIEFLFSANKKSDLQAVAEIASGGEIARVMLSLKALIADSKALPTIIFDEIDTGISGETADKMANIMRRMSKNIQVICITHLPQIASKGDVQYKVYKTSDAGTNIVPLSQEERIKEIAQMLSGAKLTDAAIDNARELLSF